MPQQPPVLAGGSPHAQGGSIAAACPDYLRLVHEYPPLVAKLVQRYPWQHIEALAAGLGSEDECLAEQFCGYDSELGETDVLAQLRLPAQ